MAPGRRIKAEAISEFDLLDTRPLAEIDTPRPRQRANGERNRQDTQPLNASTETQDPAPIPNIFQLPLNGDESRRDLSARRALETAARVKQEDVETRQPIGPQQAQQPAIIASTAQQEEYSSIVEQDVQFKLAQVQTLSARENRQHDVPLANGDQGPSTVVPNETQLLRSTPDPPVVGVEPDIPMVEADAATSHNDSHVPKPAQQQAPSVPTYSTLTAMDVNTSRVLSLLDNYEEDQSEEDDQASTSAHASKTKRTYNEMKKDHGECDAGDDGPSISSSTHFKPFPGNAQILVRGRYIPLYDSIRICQDKRNTAMPTIEDISKILVAEHGILLDQANYSRDESGALEYIKDSQQAQAGLDLRLCKNEYGEDAVWQRMPDLVKLSQPEVSFNASACMLEHNGVNITLKLVQLLLMNRQFAFSRFARQGTVTIDSFKEWLQGDGKDKKGAEIAADGLLRRVKMMQREGLPIELNGDVISMRRMSTAEQKNKLTQVFSILRARYANYHGAPSKDVLGFMDNNPETYLIIPSQNLSAITSEAKRLGAADVEWQSGGGGYVIWVDPSTSLRGAKAIKKH